MRFQLRTIILTAITSACVLAACKTNYNTTTGNFTAAKSASVERGEMLVQSSCAGCHFDQATGKLSGKRFTGTPGIAGKMFAANLTKSTTHSPMPKYSVAEFAYLMRTGIARDGHFIPYMLRPNMSDGDIGAMYAYLHSDDPQVLAHNAVAGTTDLNFIGNMGKIFLGKPLPYKASVPEVDKNNPVAYGRYLVDNIGCYHCHSKKGQMSLNEANPEETKGYMAGGRKFKMPQGTIRGANITMDKETGIGNYTKDDFRNAVLHATDENGGKLMPPMKAFHHMTDKEADAIYAYIKTLEPVKHKVN